MYRRIFQIFVFIAVFQLSFVAVSYAEETVESAEPKRDNPYFNNTGLPLPRYISLASNKVFMRSGPGLRYPIRWVYTKKGLPIEVTQEFDTWRKIRDIDGDEGWVHQSLLSGKRTAVVQGEEKRVTLYRKPDVESRKVAQLEKEVVISLEECQINWCKTEIQGFNGWIEKKLLWGVYADSEFD